ncbi:MAG: diacylglycerol kinase [Betaproteobacteria bacterium]|nr:diacylglycerol kinase [Betaproteobacteria bacterium]
MNPPPAKPATAAHPLKSTGGMGRITKALGYSLQGLNHAIRHEAAFRQELLIALPAMLGLWFLPVTLVEKIVLLATTLLVLIVELLNSAIEAVVDRVSTEHHPLSGRAKDLGSAAVLLAFILMLTAWALIVGPLLIKP